MRFRQVVHRACLPCLIYALGSTGFAQQAPKAPAAPLDATALATQAVQVLEPLPPSLWKGRLLLAAGVVQGRTGHRDAANRLFQQARAVVAKSEPSGDLFEYLAEMVSIEGFFQEVGLAQYESGDLNAALVTVAGNAAGLRPVVHALIQAGDLQQAEVIIDTRMPVDDYMYRPWAMEELAAARATRGDLERALARIRPLSGLARYAGVLGNLAVALAVAGRTDQARAVTDEAARQLVYAGTGVGRLVTSYYVAAAYGAIGNEATAITVATREGGGGSAAFREVARAQGRAGYLPAAIRSAASTGPEDRGALLAELAAMAASRNDPQTAATLCRSAVTYVIEQALTPNPNSHQTILSSFYDIGTDCTRARQDDSVSALIVFTGTADFDGSRGSVIAAIGRALIDRGDLAGAQAKLELMDADERSWLMRPLIRAYAREGRTADVTRLLSTCADAPTRAEAYIGAAEGVLARATKR